MPIGVLRFCAIVALAWLLGGCQATLDHDVGLRPPAQQAQLGGPYSAELCAASQFRKREGSIGPKIEGGGFGGHAVMFLSGVCLARDQSYPVLTLCDGAQPAHDGVGISVNAHYKNANWVATPGREFVFHGTLKPGERLGREAYERTIARAQELGTLDAIKFHEVYFKDMPPGAAERDYKYQVSLGTDFALNYARDRYCARVPLSRQQMSDMIDYLNSLNVPYRDGKREYKWNVLKDNCSHVYHNALAAAGIWSPWPTNRFVVRSALSFPVPKNEFVNLMRRVNDMPIDDIEALYADPEIRAALIKYDRLPAGPGALAELERIVQQNDVYESDISLIFYDDPLTGRYQRRYKRILADKRYTDILANARHFKALYERILSERQPLESHLARHRRSEDKAAFSTFYARYYDYVSRDLIAVNETLLKGAGQGP